MQASMPEWVVYSAIAFGLTVMMIAGIVRKAKRRTATAAPPYRGGLNDCGQYPAIVDKEGA